MLYKTFDSEFPPQHHPGGVSAVMGYIGGNADRIWSLADWQRFAKLRQFPIWGCDFRVSPGTAGSKAAEAARLLGWRDGRAIIGDCEANADRSWWVGFETTVRNFGYRAVCYGSIDFVTENHAQEYIGALYDDIPSLDNLPDLPPGERWLGKQYAANIDFEGTKIDYSVIDLALLRMGGIGERK